MPKPKPTATNRLYRQLLGKSPRVRGAKPVIIDGIRFQSTKEGERYKILKLRYKALQIDNLKLQVRFPLVVNGMLVCTYVADFVYSENGQTIVEDAKPKPPKNRRRKPYRTELYQFKKKLFQAVTGMKITEV